MTIYYVDTAAANDLGNGTSTATAWKTIAKVNASTFQPGDSVLFKRGGIWRESLVPPSSGASGNSVTFGAYGTGAKPSIRGSSVATVWTQDAGTPTTLSNIIPAAGSDDGHYSVIAQSYDNTYNDNGLGGWTAGESADSGFMRFVLDVPQGATITGATMTIRSSHTPDSDLLKFRVKAAAADDATVPATYSEANSMAKTTAYADWDGPDMTSGQDFTTVDFSPVVQEVVSRPGWVAGNHILIFLLDNGSSWYHTSFRTRDASATLCPRLTVSYGAPSGNLWYISSVANDPEVFVHDGILGARKTAKGSLGSQWDYWYDGPNSRLYTYSESDPATLATLLEYATVKNLLGYTGTSYIRFENLDIRHCRSDGTGQPVWGGWGAIGVEFSQCDFTQVGQNVIQYHNGSTGKVTGCTFTDWGINNGQSYAVQLIGYSTTASGPVAVDDCTFTMTHSQNVTEIGAVMSDQLGNLSSFQRNVCDGRVGNWARDMVTIWRPKGMTTSVIADNRFYRPGGMGIALQELEYYGDHPTITVKGNYIEDACNEDRTDTEALRLRDFTAACDVTVAYNVINGTKDGTNAHDGIRASTATNPALGAKVYHNTIVGCDTGIVADTTSSLIAQNNISSGNRVAAARKAAGATLTESYNCLFGAKTGFTAAVSDVVTDPLLGAALAPTSTSPCIDRGVAVAGIDQIVRGAAPDIGAVESFLSTQDPSVLANRRPTLKVEISFSRLPTETPLWVDVTDWVNGEQGIEINRGRGNERGSIEAGSCRFSLRNDDRRFEPLYASSPYYPNVLPMKRVRITAYTAGNDLMPVYRLFSGYISTWPQVDQGGRLSVEITAQDGTLPLSLKKLKATYPAQSVAARIQAILESAAFSSGSYGTFDSDVDGTFDDITFGPIGDQELDAGESEVVAVTYDGETALEAIQAAARAEGGTFFFDGDGYAVFHSRWRRLGGPGYSFLAGDSASGGVPYTMLSYSMSEEFIFNDISVKRDGEEAGATATDSTSQLAYFPRTLSLEGLILSSTRLYETVDRANYFIGRYKNPAIRATEIAFLNGAEERWGEVLGRDIDDRIRVLRRPKGAGPTIDQVCYVEGVSHRITESNWETTLSLSPADTTIYGVFDDNISATFDDITFGY